MHSVYRPFHAEKFSGELTAESMSIYSLYGASSHTACNALSALNTAETDASSAGDQEAKAKAYNTCIAPQAAYHSCSGAFVSQTTGVQPIGRRLSPHPQTWTCDRTAIRSPGLPFNGHHPRIPCNYTDHLLTPEGWKAEFT